MDAHSTSPLPAVYFYEDENTEETARQCTFFDNGKINVKINVTTDEQLTAPQSSLAATHPSTYLN